MFVNLVSESIFYDYASEVRMAVVEPPDVPSTPVVSNCLIGVPPPSRTRMNNVRSAEYTEVKLIVAPDAAPKMYAIQVLFPVVALSVEKSADVIVKVEPVHDEYG